MSPDGYRLRFAAAEVLTSGDRGASGLTGYEAERVV